MPPASPGPSSPTGSYWRWFLLLLVVGTLLRAVPILWGSQYYHEVQYNLHPDEPKIVRYIDDFPQSVPANHDYRYPTFLHNTYGLAWWGFGSAMGWTDPEPSFAGRPSYERALLFSRAWQVLLFGLGGMLLIGWMAQRIGAPLGNRRLVLWAIAAASIQGWVVNSTSLVQTDVPAAFGLLAVFACLAGCDRRDALQPQHGVACGAWLGAATAMKYTAAIGALAIVLTAFWALRRNATRPRGALGFVGVAALAALLVFLLFVPGALFDFQNFWISIRYEFEGKAVGEAFSWEKFGRGWLGCLPLWITLPAAWGALLWARTSSQGASPVRTWVSIGLCSAIYVAITASSFREDYAIPLAPLAALSTAWVLERIARRSSMGRAVAVVYLAAGMVHVGWTVTERYQGDTRYRFDAWVQENIPPGPLGDGPNPLRRSWSAPQAPTGYEWTSVHDHPEWVVLCERHYEPVLNVLANPKHYEALNVVFDTTERKLVYLDGRDYGFFAPEFRFYEDVLLGEDLEYHYELVQEFAPSPAPLDMQGLDVKVYRRKASEPR